MKKKYLILFALLASTVIVTLLLAFLYNKEISGMSYSYEKLNKITSTEFEEYMLEHTDAIIYISDKFDLDNNKFEKKFINKLEKLNLLENVIYIEKTDITDDVQKKLKDVYSYKYNENELPVIIVINDGEVNQISIVNDKSSVDTIINYEVFK